MANENKGQKREARGDRSLETINPEDMTPDKLAGGGLVVVGVALTSGAPKGWRSALRTRSGPGSGLP